jgi:hypothetical protein
MAKIMVSAFSKRTPLSRMAEDTPSGFFDSPLSRAAGLRLAQNDRERLSTGTTTGKMQ